jgi:hypothetical protein
MELDFYGHDTDLDADSDTDSLLCRPAAVAAAAANLGRRRLGQRQRPRWASFGRRLEGRTPASFSLSLSLSLYIHTYIYVYFKTFGESGAYLSTRKVTRTVTRILTRIPPFQLPSPLSLSILPPSLPLSQHLHSLLPRQGGEHDRTDAGGIDSGIYIYNAILFLYKF